MNNNYKVTEIKLQSENFIKCVEYEKNIDNKENNEKYPLYIRDILSYVPEYYYKNLVDISMIYVTKDSRRKGIGTNLLDKASRIFQDNVICLLASPTEYDFDEEPSKEEFNKFFEDANKFYTSCNFVNINDKCYYENSRPYLYVGNDIGKKVYRNMYKQPAIEFCK